jgi:hypothetical protein
VKGAREGECRRGVVVAEGEIHLRMVSAGCKGHRGCLANVGFDSRFMVGDEMIKKTERDRHFVPSSDEQEDQTSKNIKLEIRAVQKKHKQYHHSIIQKCSFGDGAS